MYHGRAHIVKPSALMAATNFDSAADVGPGASLWLYHGRIPGDLLISIDHEDSTYYASSQICSW